MSTMISRFFSSILECLEALGLLLCLLLTPLLRVLRGFNRIYSFVYQVKVLVPRQLMAPVLRTHLEDKLGNHQQAANLLDQVAYCLESEEEGDTLPQVSRVLRDIYCRLFKQQLLAGNIESATLTVIRAHQHIGLQKLPSTPGFDVKTAHVVKAGIAAGKLLEDGGLATLMVRQGDEPVVSSTSPTKERGKPKSKKSKDGATIIQFPCT